MTARTTEAIESKKSDLEERSPHSKFDWRIPGAGFAFSQHPPRHERRANSKRTGKEHFLRAFVTCMLMEDGRGTSSLLADFVDRASQPVFLLIFSLLFSETVSLITNDGRNFEV